MIRFEIEQPGITRDNQIGVRGCVAQAPRLLRQRLQARRYSGLQGGGIDQNAGNQEFLQGLCNVAHTIGIAVIAVGVQNEAELATLRELGFDGATGPGVKG